MAMQRSLQCIIVACFLTISVSPCLTFELDIPSTGFVCEIAKCLRGTCMNTSSFPFYQCDCDDGWKSPFGSSWLPCIMPNFCSLAVCGNGECIHGSSGNGSTQGDHYVCKCDDGFFNFRNKSDGYCIHKCSFGADCTNLSLPLSGASPTSPNTQSSNQESNQGTSSSSRVRNETNQGNKYLPNGLVLMATMALVYLYV